MDDDRSRRFALKYALAVVVLGAARFAHADASASEQAFPGFGSIADGMPAEPQHVMVVARMSHDAHQDALAPAFSFTPMPSGFLSESLFTVSPGTLQFDETMMHAVAAVTWQQRWHAGEGGPTFATAATVSTTADTIDGALMLIAAQSLGRAVLYASTWGQTDRTIGGTVGLKLPIVDGLSTGTSVRIDTSGKTAFELASVFEVNPRLTISPGVVFLLHETPCSGVNVGWTL